MTAIERGLKYSIGTGVRTIFSTDLNVIVDDDTCIDRTGAFLIQPDRVDIELHNTLVLLEETGNVGDDPDEIFLVTGLGAAVPGNERVCIDLLDHLADLFFRDGQDAERHIFHELDHGPAHTERDDLAERCVGPAADDQLEAGFGLLLDDHTLDVGIGVVGFCPVDDLRKCAEGRFPAADTDNHTAGIALVDDLGRDDLHDDRAAHAFTGMCCVFSALHDLVFRYRKIVLPEHIISFCFTQHFLGH